MTKAVPVQARAKERFGKIFEAAKSHFYEVGPESFSVETVASKVGCSTGTIYRYFESRRGLLDAVAPENYQSDLVLDEILSTNARLREENEILRLEIKQLRDKA